mgnify:CR=1 FL=1
MLEYNLFYDGVDTHLTTKGNKFFLQNEAPELSFDFNQIIYDPDNQQFQYTTNDNQTLLNLNELQIAEIEDYLEYYMDEHDYIVHAYSEPYNLFEGSMAKSTAEAQGFSYRINEIPTDLCPKWVEEHQRWENCVLIIYDDGAPLYHPEGICSRCVKGFTYEEFQNIPEQPSPYHLWDLANDVWYDGRTLERAKLDAAVSIRADFEIYRHEMSPYKYFIGDYENITWQYQLDEAKHWLEDNSWSTPYIDTFLLNRTDNDIPTKEEFCNDVIENNNEFIIAIAKINAEQWQFLSQLKHCITNEECIEVSNQAKLYCENKRTNIQLSIG